MLTFDNLPIQSPEWNEVVELLNSIASHGEFKSHNEGISRKVLRYKFESGDMNNVVTRLNLVFIKVLKDKINLEKQNNVDDIIIQADAFNKEIVKVAKSLDFIKLLSHQGFDLYGLNLNKC